MDEPIFLVTRLWLHNQLQETARHLKHSFANCYWLHTRYKHSNLHEKTKVLPMDTHFRFHAIQLKQLTQTQTHPLHQWSTKFSSRGLDVDFLNLLGQSKRKKSSLRLNL